MRLGYLPKFCGPAADERSQDPPFSCSGGGSRLATTKFGPRRMFRVCLAISPVLRDMACEWERLADQDRATDLHQSDKPTEMVRSWETSGAPDVFFAIGVLNHDNR